jgi:hypothetical protein
MPNIAVKCMQRFMRWTGYEIRKRAKEQPPRDFAPHEVEDIEAVTPFTQTAPDRMIALVRALEHVCAHGIPGDIVECGVWKGGSIMLAAKTLLRLGEQGRHLHLFDTFQGMSDPTDLDVDYEGTRAADHMDRHVPHTLSPLEEVRANLFGTGYPRDAIHFVEGKVEDTLPSRAPERIALLRLDTDWYESTYHELVHLYPLLSPGGILIIDDYGHWRGSRRAVDQYLEENDLKLFLHRIDYTGRLAVKPAPAAEPAPAAKGT